MEIPVFFFGYENNLNLNPDRSFIYLGFTHYIKINPQKRILRCGETKLEKN